MSQPVENPGTTTQRDAAPKKRSRLPLVAAAVALTAFLTFGITALLLNILDRQQEAEVPYARVAEVDVTTVDPAVWGQNFPVQYEMFKRTSEMGPTAGHGGSQPTDHTPTDTDPRTVVSSSRLEEDPRLVTMWAGYPFSVDYRHARGHEYMLEDQLYTLRVQEFNQPGTCLNCHASMPASWHEMGDGDQRAGFDAMNAMPYDEAVQHFNNPISCIDCHNPDTMALQITRPAFIDGIRDLKASEGIEDYDVNRDATAAEMRSFVCGQCHVEYYFDGEGKTLTFPWSNGIKVEEILGYYLMDGHVDFTHANTETPIIKAQHPEFDIWTQGVHASAGVSCVDCHMPYEREGSYKVSNHQIQSPLLNVSASCGVCHNDTEEALTDRVLNIQDNFMHTRDATMDSLMVLIDAIEAALTDGTDAADVQRAQEYHQAAQFYIDYVYSENGFGFHADQYMMRILADAQYFILQGHLALGGEDVGTVEQFLIDQGVTLDMEAVEAVRADTFG
ncbi:MAG: ammonia-forming cytochrome c nitrite reductase subunit c552 [bacterium]|nr:ammonia-forming cytochrome c nitrite reductase subunit c552 [bacterium]